MFEFFMNNTLCLTGYLLVIILMMFSMTLNKLKGYVLALALVVFVVDISALMIIGFELHKLAIVTGICVILVLASIKEGRNYEL